MEKVYIANPNNTELSALVTDGGALYVTARAASLSASAPAYATVGETSGEVVASNPNRTGLVLTNTSANTISFGVGYPAVLNSGITLSSYGVFLMDAGTFSQDAIYAIASAAGSNLAIQEFE